MTTGETISSVDLGLQSRATTALWSSSFAIVIAAATSVLYAVAILTPPTSDVGAGTPAIMIEFSPIPLAIEADEDSLSAEGSDVVESNDDEAVEGSPEPSPYTPIEREPVLHEPQTLSPDPAPAETERPALLEPLETESEPELISDSIDMPLDPVEIDTPQLEAELTLPQRAAIPEEIAQLRAQTPATSHAPPQQQSTAPRREAPASIAASQTAPQAAAPATPQAPPAPQISPQRWQGQLFAHLERFKRYPAAASQRREQGTVYIQFSIDTLGNILSSRIIRSSGYADLDDAVAQIMRSASPVPRPPADLGSPVTLTVPIDFTLR